MDAEKVSFLTKALDDILKKRNFNVLKYEFPNTQFKGGFIAKMINIKATVEKHHKTELLDILVKTNQYTVSYDFTEAYLSEMNIYCKIVPCFNVFADEHNADKIRCLPFCYGVYSAEDHFVVFLENLNSKDFTVREYAPLDMDHIKLLLKAYARWHAFSFALKDQKPEEFNKLIAPKTVLEESKFIDSIVRSLEEQIDFAISLYEEKDKPMVLDRLKSLRSKYRVLFGEFLRNEDDEYVAICHSDVWNNNFMFKYKEEFVPTEVKILDWQTAMLGSPLIDISQLFFWCCIRPEIEHIDDFLKVYHQTLSANIRQLGSEPEECFPWEACLKSFKRYAPLAIAGVPFLVRMYFSNKFMKESKGYEDVSDDGNFSGVLGEEISNPEAFFERLNDILELCVERDLI